MNITLESIDPFYADCLNLSASPRLQEPEQPRHLAREDRVGVDPFAVPLQEPGPGPLRQRVEAGPLRGGEGGQPGDLARGQGRGVIRRCGRARRAGHRPLGRRGEPEGAPEALEVDGASEAAAGHGSVPPPPRPRPPVADVDSDPFYPNIHRGVEPPRRGRIRSPWSR